MGLVQRFASGYVSSDLANPRYWLTEWASGGMTNASGEPVTAETAMGLSAYYACLRNISEDVAKIPRQVRRNRAGRGSDPVYDHPVWRVWTKRPNPLMSGFSFVRTMTHRAMGWGLACAEIVRDGLGNVRELWPIHPSRIQAKIADDGRGVVYEWRATPSSTPVPLASDQVFALSSLGDGMTGYSVLRLASESLGLGLAAQKHAGAFYGEGMSRRMVAFVKEVMDPNGRAQLRKRILGDKDKDPVGQRRLPIIEGDVTLADMGIPPEEAQFLESREFSVEDVARWFRMALAKLQYHKRAQGWSSLEALNTDYVIDALTPWAVCWEEEAWAKLLTEEEQQDHYFKFMFQGLLRGDYASRTAGYSTLRNIGVMSANDIRELEDMNPIEPEEGDGDLYLVQGALKPMREEELEPAPVPAAFTESVSGALDVPPEEEEQEDEEAGEDESKSEEPGVDVGAVSQALRPVFLDAARRVVKRQQAGVAAALKRNRDNPEHLAEWTASYWVDQVDVMREAFAPGVTAWAMMARVPVVSIDLAVAAPADLEAFVGCDVEPVAEAMAAAMLAHCGAAVEVTRG